MTEATPSLAGNAGPETFAAAVAAGIATTRAAYRINTQGHPLRKHARLMAWLISPQGKASVEFYADESVAEVLVDRSVPRPLAWMTPFAPSWDGQAVLLSGPDLGQIGPALSLLNRHLRATELVLGFIPLRSVQNRAGLVLLPETSMYLLLDQPIIRGKRSKAGSPA